MNLGKVEPFGRLLRASLHKCISSPLPLPLRISAPAAALGPKTATLNSIVLLSKQRRLATSFAIAARKAAMPKRETGTDAAGAPTEGADRKSSAPTQGAKKKQKLSDEHLVHPKRWQELKGGDIGDGPVIYWYMPCKLP